MSNHIKTSLKDFLAEKYSLLTESMIKKVLYHGSIKQFDKFRSSTAFFSETPNFAIRYVDTKSLDYGTDDDQYLYTVEINCDIFDIDNKEDYYKLAAVLPNTIKYYYNDFGFDTTVDKKEYLLNLTGYYTNEPIIDNIDNVKIGDKIPDPSYKSEFFIVYDVDDDYVYAYSEHVFNDKYNSSKYKNYGEFEELYKFLADYIKHNSDINYITTNDIRDFYAVFVMKKSYHDIPVPNETELEKFNKLNEEYNQNIMNYFIKNDWIKKFNKKTTIDKLEDTWRYYENKTTENLIKELGYCGYVALEKKVKTYAIFNPDVNVTILKKERV
jgi:hypothetical protein